MYFFGCKIFLMLGKFAVAKKKRSSSFRNHGVLKGAGSHFVPRFRRGIGLKIIPYHGSRVDNGLIISRMGGNGGNPSNRQGLSEACKEASSFVRRGRSGMKAGNPLSMNTVFIFPAWKNLHQLIIFKFIKVIMTSTHASKKMGPFPLSFGKSMMHAPQNGDFRGRGAGSAGIKRAVFLPHAFQMAAGSVPFLRVRTRDVPFRHFTGCGSGKNLGNEPEAGPAIIQQVPGSIFHNLLVGIFYFVLL